MGREIHTCTCTHSYPIPVTHVGFVNLCHSLAVHMGVKETGMQIGHRGAYNQPPSGEWEQVYIQPQLSNQRSISPAIIWKWIAKKEGWNPQAPGRPMRWPGWHMVAWSSGDDHVISDSAWVPEAVEVPSDLWFWPPLRMWLAGAPGAWLGVVRTNRCSLWSPNGGWWSKPGGDRVEMTRWYLALGTDHDAKSLKGCQKKKTLNFWQLYYITIGIL